MQNKISLYITSLVRYCHNENFSFFSKINLINKSGVLYA